MDQTGQRLLETKQHFDVLDGLRGVAALAVVTFHFMEWVFADYSDNFIGHGFLAVDFFFCLSGFVIGYAYDDRILKMGLGEFFKSRIIRLHPLVVLGSVLGLLAFLFDPFGGDPQAYSAGKLLLAFVSSVMLIPMPALADRSYNLFGFNAPAWSLFWEYIANLFYALLLCRLRNNLILLLLTIVAAGGLFLVGYNAHNLLGGWSGPTFWDGAGRVSYSFLAGLLIYRSGWIIKNRLGFGGMTILLCIAFLMPTPPWAWIAELLVVLFYFPLLISLGAGTTLSVRWTGLCRFAGRISYPLYMTHYAVLWMFGHYYGSHKPGTLQLLLIVAGGIVLLIGFAWLVMLCYDLPLRRYFTSLRKNQKAAP